MTKKRWGLDAPGAFVSGISRSEMTKKRWGLDAPGAFVFFTGATYNNIKKESSKKILTS